MPITLAHGFFDATCPEEWTWTSDEGFRDYDLWYVGGGQGWMRIDDGPTLEVTRGTCLCFRPGMRHHAWHNPERPLRVWAQHFTLSGKEKSLEPPVRMVLEDLRFYEALFSRISTWRASAEEGYLTELFHTILVTLAHDDKRREHTSYMPYHQQGLLAVEKVLREHVEKRYANRELAQMAEMHENYFVRAFTRYFGEPPRQRAMRIRAQTACQWLMESNLSIKQIAASLGYPDQASFSKQFKHIMGQSPLAYRQSAC